MRTITAKLSNFDTVFIKWILIVCLSLPGKGFSNGNQQYTFPKHHCGFIENKGQIINQNGKLNPAVLYLLNTPGLNVQLRKTGFSYDLYTASGHKPQDLDLMSAFRFNTSDTLTPVLRPEACSLHFHRIDFDLLNTNSDCEIITSEPFSDYLNYYTTGTPVKGVTNVRSYKMIIYKNIYPGIDLEFLFDEKLGFKYNFLIGQEGNLNSIRIKISGPEINLTESGTLLLKTTIGTIEEVIPQSFTYSGDIKKEITTRFRLLGKNIYGIYCPDFSQGNQALMIDPRPIRLWATYYGGSLQDNPFSCLFDASGNVYISGWTESTNNIATSGSFQSVYGGNYDAFLVKLTSTGQRIWGTYYGGSSAEIYSWANIDHTGNIYMSGETHSDSNIATPGSYQPVRAGPWDAFLVKFNSNGYRIWGTYYGGMGYSSGRFCIPDDSCNIYIGGETSVPSGMATPGAYQTTCAGVYDGFLVKFDSSGQRIWATYYGGSNYDQAQGCSLSNNMVFVCGETQSLDGISTPGSFQPVFGGGVMDTWIARFTTSGQRVWGTYYGGSLSDRGIDCAADSTGNAYLTGWTRSTNNIATPGSFQPVYGGNQDAFLAKFNSTGQRIWGTYYGGTLGDESTSCAVDDSGHVYICGQTSSLENVGSLNGYQPVYGGGVADAFLVKFDSNNQRIWGTYYGDTAGDWGQHCSIDHCGHILFTGYTLSTNNISTPGTFQTTLAGSTDVFLVKFADCSGADSAGPITGPVNVCQSSNGIVFFVPLIAHATGYSWILPPGFTIINGSNTDTITVNIGNNAVSGNISVYGTSCCYDGAPSSVFVAVHQRPLPVITGLDTACTGQSCSYSTAPGKSQYLWNVFGGNITSGAGTNIITVNWNSPGAQWLEVNYTDTNNCSALTPAHKNVWVIVSSPVIVTITASADTVCQGSQVTFAATPINPGSNPIYQWFVNGFNVGINNPVYSFIPSNNDCIFCRLTSNITCPVVNPVNSNTICITVKPILPVSVTISFSVNPACSGIPVTFTATAVNGGSSPVFQWKINGINVGTNSPVYTYIPFNGDSVNCVMSSSEVCTTNNPATSNLVIMVINSNLVVGVSIAASANPVCAGTFVTFTATPVNGGPLPTYQWKVNGINVGINSPTYTYNPASGDLVSCILTSSLPCTSNNPAFSNPVSVIVNQGPVVTFTKCNDTITTTNAKPFKLKGGIPFGGTYSGPGVNPVSGIWYPASAGAGNKTITYTYTNAALCSATASRVFRVIAAPAFTCGNLVTDVRDNQIYQTVQIGGQCWMAENLIFGTEIPDNLVQRDNCIPEKYTRPTSYVPRPTYYQWDELMQYDDTPALQGLCPPGWHIPSEAEWNQLFAVYNGAGFAGSPLLSTGFSGFNALVNGSRFENVTWDFENFATHYWTSTSWGTIKAWSHAMNNVPDDHSVSTYPSSRSNAFSVRCIKD